MKTPKKRGAKPIPMPKRKELRKACKICNSTAEVGALFQVSRNTAQKWIDKYGLDQPSVTF